MRQSAARFGTSVKGTDEIQELRGIVLTPILAGLPAAACLLILALSIKPDILAPQLIGLVPALFGVSLLSRRLLERGVIWAAGFTTVTLFLLVTWTTWSTPNTSVCVLYSLVALIAATTLGQVAGFVTAALSTSAIYLGVVEPTPVIGDEVALTSTVLVWAATFVSWSTARPIYTALDWAWSSYSQALSTTNQLRDRQRELVSTVKSLNDAYNRLEHLNDELARARQAAEEARRLKSEFAANISHELRTPLNLIIGFSEVMVSAPQTYRGQRLPEAYRADVDAIYRSATHLSSLIDDVLELSQIEAGRVGLVREPISVGSVAQEAVGAVGALFESKGLSLDVSIANDLPPVSADRTRVRQVIINLLTNAGRFTSKGGAAVSARLQDRDVLVTVSDTGVGIPVEDLPKVFDEFYQVDGSLRRQVGGTGLGLAISKQFVELHGGSMWVESHIGVGTSFHFTLPLALNVISSIAPGDWTLWKGNSEGRESSSASLALLCPDQSVARIFERHLDGYHLNVTGSWSEARQLMVRDDPAALIVVTPSVEDAWKETAEIQRQLGDKLVVICSMPSHQEISRELGISDYLVKPISRQDLLHSLDKLGGSTRNVLIVDDDRDMVRLLGRMLRSSRRGYRVWRATSGEEALVMLRERLPDVVLLDLLMSRPDGYAVLQAMRQTDRLKDVPVVVLTSHGAQKTTVSAGLLAFTRPGGLSVRDLMSCLSASLHPLLARSRASEPTPEPRVAAGV